MIIDLLGRTSGAPDALGLVGERDVWTYAGLEEVVSERAGELRSEGVRSGQVVPMTLDAAADALISLLAVWRAGATVAPLNAKLTHPERTDAERALVGRPSDAQAVLWTSGTAGRPRGVAISYGNLVASALGAQKRLDLGADDVWLASLSPAHVGGLALITRAILLGSSLVAVGPFDVERTLQLIEGRGARAPVTHLSVVPTQLARLLDASKGRPPPETFRCALVGGAHAPEALVARAVGDGWPLALTYGLTEATSQVATAPPALTARTPGTVGRPLDGVEVRIEDDGEILVRGATVVGGYVGIEDDAVTSPDGWLHTGDLGRVDEDGALWVTGRRSDRIVTGGVTVDAVEVEEALRSHPAVADACVVGLPDAEWGERVGAWVVPEQGSVDQDQLLAFLRQRLTGAKLPRVLHEGPELPRNANGKVDRKAVGAMIAAAGGRPRTGRRSRN